MTASSVDKAMSGFIKAGPWAILALFLIFEARPSLAMIRAEHAELRAEMNEAMREVIEATRQSAYLEFRNCINTAQTAELRDKCVPPPVPTREMRP